MKKWIWLLLILGGGLGLAACSGRSPQIELEVTQMDFGDVVNGEIASRDVTIRNLGGKSLVIETVTTSCGCTSASVDPMAIGPGETANLHIEVNTGAHGPELTGPLVRQVFISSNDPNQPEAQVELAVNILPRP